MKIHLNETSPNSPNFFVMKGNGEKEVDSKEEPDNIRSKYLRNSKKQSKSLFGRKADKNANDKRTIEIGTKKHYLFRTYSLKKFIENNQD